MDQLKNIFKKNIRIILFNTLGRIGYRIKKKKNIVILTSSRSGSTWFVESILLSLRAKHINQPYDCFFNNNVYKNKLPINNDNFHFINLSNSENKKLNAYWSKLVNGNININSTWNVFSKEFKFLYERKIFKIFFLKEKIDFFTEQKDIIIFYLIRNPLDTSLSNINYNYGISGDSLIKNKAIEKYPKEFKKLKTIYLETDNILMKYIIGWAFENYKPYTYAKSNNQILMLRYEDLKDRNKYILKRLKAELGEKFTLKKTKSKTFNNQKPQNNNGISRSLILNENYNFLKSTIKKYFDYNI